MTIVRMRQVNPEVFYADERVVQVDAQVVEQLRGAAGASARKRARLCAHRDTANAVHEMLIVMALGTYVRPHKHLDKSESFHVISGRADVVLFTDTGQVEQVIELGDYATGHCFFYRLADPIYHTILIRSETLVVHETTRGPFDPAQTILAPWAPEENDLKEVLAYQEAINRQITRRK